MRDDGKTRQYKVQVKIIVEVKQSNFKLHCFKAGSVFRFVGQTPEFGG